VPIDRKKALRRFALSTGNNVVSVPLATVATSFPGTPLLLPTIDAKQALRIISGLASVSDPNETGELTCLGASLVLEMANPPNTGLKQLRIWQPNFSNVLMGKQGIRWGFIDDEYLYGTDYLEFLSTFGGAAGSFDVAIDADITNADAANAHDVQFQITLLCEIYQLSVMP
jgi:hypothetical protein